MDQPGHGPTKKGLGGVRHPIAEGAEGLPGPPTEVFLVVDKRRRTNLFTQLEHVDAANGQATVRPNLGGIGEEMARRRRGGGARGLAEAHIVSGAVTPSRPRPIANPMRAASTSHNLAC